MPKRPKKDYAPQTSGTPPVCYVTGCRNEGVYKAPESKKKLNEYQWFCLDHIREHNQKWDFFAGMDRKEIENFMKDAMTGHRPTWSRESQVRMDKHARLQEALSAFLEGDIKSHLHRSLPPRLQNALKLLDIEYPYTGGALKKRYRSLVKKHHPDVNRGDKKSEEKFKEVTAAYLYLSKHLEEA